MEAERSIWCTRAERLLQQAIAEIDVSDAVFGYMSAADVCLRIEYGELPEDTLDGYPFPDEEPDESGCTCPADLAARGGFASSCPVHGLRS